MSDALALDIVPDLGEPTLVLAFDGWNDAGDAATGAVGFVSEAIRSAPLGEIDAEPFYDFTVQRPLVKMGASGAREITWPTFELRYGTFGEHALVLGSGAEPHLRWRQFTSEIAALVDTLSVRRVVLLGAYLADVLYSRPVRVSGYGASEILEPLGVQPTHYEGPTGIVGVLAAALPDLDVEVVSFWAGLPHYLPLSPNPRGTLALVQKLATYLDLPLDRTPLEREAAEFEERVSKHVASDPNLAEYVRELKKREFAQ